MLLKIRQQRLENSFSNDTLDWFLGNRHGHMGKWQYMEPKSATDTCRGNELWDIWENLSQEGNMLNRQKQVIKDHANEIAVLTGPITTLIDLGPGGERAVQSNTIPFVHAYGEALDLYTAIDMNKDFAIWATEQVKRARPSTQVSHINEDYYGSSLPLSYNTPAAVLFFGGTIGNFQAEQNTPNAVALMAAQIKKLKQSMPKESFIFIGLEATQDPALLYGDYDNPAHAIYEINVMHGIKRDVIPDEDGFNPSAWKYSMAWWPEAFQFCHICEATEAQSFSINGAWIDLPKGKQLVVDNSFKFPIIAMQRAAQLAGATYIQPFADEEGRMVVHVIRL